MSPKAYLLLCLLGALCRADDHYGAKALSALLRSEYKALNAQESLLQKPQSNEQVKQSIIKTIKRIKERIKKLENERESESPAMEQGQ